MIEPNVGKIFVRVATADEKTAGGIIVPGTVARETQTEGTVVAVGAPRLVNGEPVSIALEPGNRVLFDTLGTIKIKADVGNGKEELVVCRAEDVLARL